MLSKRLGGAGDPRALQTADTAPAPCVAAAAAQRGSAAPCGRAAPERGYGSSNRYSSPQMICLSFPWHTK